MMSHEAMSKAASADWLCSLAGRTQPFDRPGQALGIERIGPDHVAAGKLFDRGTNDRSC